MRKSELLFSISHAGVMRTLWMVLSLWLGACTAASGQAKVERAVIVEGRPQVVVRNPYGGIRIRAAKPGSIIARVGEEFAAAQEKGIAPAGLRLEQSGSRVELEVRPPERSDSSAVCRPDRP